MNTKQCKELRRAIVESYPPFKEIERLKKANLTPQEKGMLRDLQIRFKKVYKKAKRQYKETSQNQRSVIKIK